jgi:hypothetical protein
MSTTFFMLEASQELACHAALLQKETVRVLPVIFKF